MGEPGREGETADLLDAETRARPATPSSAAAATDRFTPGRLLAGRFRIVAPLGKGGMGEVYRAEDLKLGQAVALKFVPARVADDPAALARLLAEVRVGRQVTHPNVCRLHDIFEGEGHHFVCMEYVDGEDLASLLRRIGRLPPDKALEIARGICAGLAAAHENEVVHRDLKPANVMVDGRGQARIADFGLAALAADVRAGEGLAGTPAYMAPEQLAGEPASPRTDVYALGLVLYETFTGERRFQASTLGELRERHREARPPSFSSVAGMDPAVERAIVRCLHEDPAARPATARAVLAALPGGDPLQAAIEAGETPSPAMVAAAGARGDLPAGAAWAALAAVVAGLLLTPAVARQAQLHRQVELTRPPELLAERARGLAASLGHPEPAADSAFRFLDGRATAGLPLLFAYRQSPESLLPLNDTARVQLRDPAFDLPGMVEVLLDPRGRLVSFAAVPPAREERPGPFAEPDWALAFREAGLDPSRFRPVAPIWTAPADTDLKRAWEDESVRVRAASLRGLVVWFDVGPLAKGPVASGERPAGRAARLGFLAFMVLIHVGGAVVARSNLRSGRGDRRGAARLAWFLLILRSLAGLLLADHHADPGAEWEVAVTLLASSLYNAALGWVMYMAVEPHFRRRFPHMLISWSRLLAGRWRDPMVGRDVLLGGAAGVGLALVIGTVAYVAPGWLGLPHLSPRDVALAPLGSLRTMAGYVCARATGCVGMAIGTLCGLLLMRVLLRSERLALLGVYLFAFTYTLTQVGQGVQPVLELVMAALFSALALPLIARMTLLGLVSAMYFMRLLEVTPLTLDPRAFHLDRMALAFGVLLALAATSFHISLGGKAALPALEE